MSRYALRVRDTYPADAIPRRKPGSLLDIRPMGSRAFAEAVRTQHRDAAHLEVVELDHAGEVARW